MSNQYKINEQVSAIPLVAVCLAAFNGMNWLPEQLSSILAQKDVDVIVFISVDRSSDNTEVWVDKIALDEPRIVVLPHGEKFGGAARNFFRLLRDIDFSKFKYVSFADQDDIWLPEKLIKAHKLLLATGAAAYSSNVLAFWASGRTLLIKKSQPQQRWDFLFEAAGPGCTYVMKRELACAIQDFLRSRWNDMQDVGLHDWFSYAYARSNGYRWVIDEYPGMLYRQHEKNQFGVNSGWRAYFHRAQKVLNGWGLNQSTLIANLLGLANDPFVKSWSGESRLGFLWLGLHAGQCRRRMRDQILFGLSCIALCMLGKGRR